MTRVNSILKIFSKNFIKTFFIINFLLSLASFSYAAPIDEPCAPTGYSSPDGNISGSSDCLVDSIGTTANNAASQAAAAAKNVECNGSDNFNCYTLLEGFGNKATVTIAKDGLGSYLEQIMTYMLMIVTIAAVFFMIYGGVLYLTTDIVNKKAEGREVITRVVLGLIFVFSVWTIMNSINSGLLKNSLNFSLDSLGKGIIGAVAGTPAPTGSGAQPGSAASPPQTQPKLMLGACSEGVVEVQNGYKLCASVAEKMKSLLALAAKEGINLQLSSGFRDPQKQIDLRKKNCGTSDYDIYQKPSRLCTPQTAIPGTSNHEKGVAVDFQDMSSKNDNYDWLTKNAPTFGFYNNYAATKEYWHWSVNGR
jgi:hypothetical protein